MVSAQEQLFSTFWTSILSEKYIGEDALPAWITNNYKLSFFTPEISHKPFHFFFWLLLQSGTGCVTEYAGTAGTDPVGQWPEQGCLGEEIHAGSSNESWHEHCLLCVLWVKNSPHGSHTVNHSPHNCLFKSLSHYMWLPRQFCGFSISTSTEAHRHVTPPLHWTAVPSLAQFDHPLCKDVSQGGHLWTQAGGNDGPLLPAGQGAARMSTVKQLFFHLQESEWQAAFRAVGDRYKCIFSNYTIVLSCLFSIWESRANWHNYKFCFANAHRGRTGVCITEQKQ